MDASHPSGSTYEAWVALDDCDWMFSPSCRQLVPVDPETGFDDLACRINNFGRHQ